MTVIFLSVDNFFHEFFGHDFAIGFLSGDTPCCGFGGGLDVEPNFPNGANNGDLSGSYCSMDASRQFLK